MSCLLLFFSVRGGTGKQVGPQARIDRHTGLVEAGVGVVGVAAIRRELRRLCG